MKITTKILLGFALLISGLVMTRIIVSSMFSVDGIALSQMNTQIASLDRENMILKERIYSASSYTVIASDAATMGFVEEKSQISLSNASSIAIKQ
ncbi:MAG TPA: hypothetical protein VLB73_02915 [Patescibacteria group bacterium]|nr:hypothetical protein [Patescibacteria group bacterium]